MIQNDKIAFLTKLKLIKNKVLWKNKWECGLIRKKLF